MSSIVSFVIQKGGCGKTTTTVNTAGYLSGQGFKVLAVDMDPQGNLTQHLGYDNESLKKTILQLFLNTATFEEVVLQRNEYLHILPQNLAAAAEIPRLQKMNNAEYLLRDLLNPVAWQYDYVLIDCPPTLGLFSMNALVASSEFVIVVSPDFFPMKAIKPLYETYRMVKYRLNPPLQFNGIMLTMCDFRTRHNQEIYQILRRNFPNKLYRSYIRQNVSLKEAAAYGQTIFEYNSQSIGAFDYQNFTEEFMRDHHRNQTKREYYQHRFESLPEDEQQQIIQFATGNLSVYIRKNAEKIYENPVQKEAFLIERNKILEKLFPYRSNPRLEKI